MILIHLPAVIICRTMPNQTRCVTIFPIYKINRTQKKFRVILAGDSSVHGFAWEHCLLRENCQFCSKLMAHCVHTRTCFLCLGSVFVCWCYSQQYMCLAQFLLILATLILLSRTLPRLNPVFIIQQWQLEHPFLSKVSSKLVNLLYLKYADALFCHGITSWSWHYRATEKCSETDTLWCHAIT